MGGLAPGGRRAAPRRRDASRGTSPPAGRSTSSSAAGTESTTISRSPCPNSRFDEIAEALGGLEIFLITDRTEATPLAEARDRFFDTHQTWVREPATGFWRLDVFREPSDGDTWICRREPALRMPYARLIEWTDDGIPYGRPEVILLMKAKHSQLEKNERDLAATLPRLDGERRAWLRDALARVHPGHEWLDAL